MISRSNRFLLYAVCIAAFCVHSSLAAIQAQTKALQAMSVAADVRWVGTRCPEYTAEWQQLKDFMHFYGIKDFFNPGGVPAKALDAYDAAIDEKAKVDGTEVVCANIFKKYDKTGLIRPKTREEKNHSDDLKALDVPAPNLLGDD